MENQRLILFIALAAVIIMIWQEWQLEYGPKQGPAAVTETTAKQNSQTVPATPDVVLPQQGAGVPVAAKQAELPSDSRITVTTDLIEVAIDSYGGDIRSLKLLKHPVAANEPDSPFPLLRESGDELFIAQSGLIGKDGRYPSHDTRYSVTKTLYQLPSDQNQVEVALNWKSPEGVRFSKIFTFHRDSYVIDIRYEINNASRSVRKVHQYGQFRRNHADKSMGLTALPTYAGGAIYTPEEHYEKITFSDMTDQPLKRNVKGGWVALLQHYFVGSWMPGPEDFSQFYGRRIDGDQYVTGFTSILPVEIRPGEQGQLRTRLYVGPKEHKRLIKLSEGMDLTVDFGLLTFISAPLYWLLTTIHDWVGNWGLAIIFLTLIIKLVFFPLSAASYKSMAHMRRVQPKLQAIKERYGDDKQRFNQAMMEIYKTEKINPLGGCLPILIQIPVFIALYWVLLETVEMRHAPFVLWIRDLSSPDPYFILPLIMGVSMYAQHWLNPAPLDPIQKKIMQFMPAMFTVFFLFFPAGLVLYWVVNNILSIAQQWQITRMIEAQGR
ncbi:MAG: membrane protein insertase YidC [Gammaproteobacteria bacterium]|nr:membrane protein insertase YidC [Gammaproteobacteria bacterium]